MNILKLFMLSSAIAMTVSACNSSKKIASNEEENTSALEQVKVGGTHSVVSPKVIVYRTKNDYINNVPVIMDETKTTLVSYPDPVDVSGSANPTKLDGGYLLDNRGIGTNVVFTSYTYDEYAKLSAVPSQAELIAHIIDKDPIQEMWVCAPRHTYKDLIADLNRLVKEGFPGCKKVK